MIPLNDDSVLHTGAGWIERQDVGRLRLRGADRRSYLHGLLTNDIESLKAGTGVYAALLTAQGRMISDMHVYELGDSVLITLPRSLTGAMRDRLDQFVFSEDVQVEDVTETTVQIGVYGPSERDAISSLRASEIVLPSREFGIAGSEVVTTVERAANVKASIESAGVRPIPMDALETARVEAGVPRFLVDMSDTTIPLEAGIEDRAISMTKGCYPGQEVIVRVLHRGGGRVAKKLVGLMLSESAAVPAAGTPVYSAAREIGTITSAVRSPRLGRPIALGYLHRDFVTPGTSVEIDSAQGRLGVEVHALPFVPAEY